MGLHIEWLEELLLIGAIVAMVTRRLRVPYTVGLTLAGIAVAAAHLSVHLQLTRELIFSTLLPPLIFEAALQIRWKELRADAGVIGVMATLGIVLAAGVVAGGLRLFVDWPWAIALLFGLLISATDPVSVIATFKETGVTGRFRFLVETESLLNDGTVAVFYGVALAVGAGGQVGVAEVAGRFLETFAGAVVVGGGIGGAVLLMARGTDDHLVEITLSTLAAYLSFGLAERLGFSGVLATMTAGILIANTHQFGPFFTERGLEALERFWEYAGFVANSIIFLLIGTSLVIQHVATGLAVGALAVRALAVYGCCALFARTGQRVPRRHQHLLVWGGLRGALALALALSLPQGMPGRDAAISATFAVVAFSILVQGLTITPLLRHLGELQR
jgi:CPA1 family monovalent cation:H+ antiporter